MLGTSEHLTSEFIPACLPPPPSSLLLLGMMWRRLH